MKKTCLIVAPSFPYPINGGNKVALHGFITAIKNSGYHQVDFIGFDSESKEIENNQFGHVELVRKPPKIRVVSLLKHLFGNSILFERFFSEEFKSKLIKLVNKNSYDLIFFQHGYMCQYLKYIQPYVKDSKLIASSEVLESRAFNEKALLTSNPIKKALLKRESKLLNNIETNALDQFKTITFFSDEDYSHFKRCGGNKAEGKVVNLGLDLDRYSLLPSPGQGSEFTVAFFGSFSWFANLDALEYLIKDIWPEVLKLDKSIKLKIAGRDIPIWLSNISNSNLEICGEVDSIADFLLDVHLVLSPIRIGGGVRLKMLESFAWGRPVLSTTIGTEGLDDLLLTSVIVADTPQNFAQKIIDVKSTPPDIMREICNLVRSKYDAKNLSHIFTYE